MDALLDLVPPSAVHISQQATGDVCSHIARPPSDDPKRYPPSFPPPFPLCTQTNGLDHDQLELLEALVTLRVEREPGASQPKDVGLAATRNTLHMH